MFLKKKQNTNLVQVHKNFDFLHLNMLFIMIKILFIKKKNLLEMLNVIEF